jgi:hypothetical protein
VEYEDMRERGGRERTMNVILIRDFQDWSDYVRSH